MSGGRRGCFPGWALAASPAETASMPSAASARASSSAAAETVMVIKGRSAAASR